MRDDVAAVILEAAKIIDQTLVEKMPLERGTDCPLYGEGSVIDSISLVSLVVLVEQKIEDKFDTPIILADEKAMSRKRSPFLTIATLAEYVEERMKEGV